jgi:hypothetical protein
MRTGSGMRPTREPTTQAPRCGRKPGPKQVALCREHDKGEDARYDRRSRYTTPTQGDVQRLERLKQNASSSHMLPKQASITRLSSTCRQKTLMAQRQTLGGSVVCQESWAQRRRVCSWMSPSCSCHKKIRRSKTPHSLGSGRTMLRCPDGGSAVPDCVRTMLGCPSPQQPTCLDRFDDVH